MFYAVSAKNGFGVFDDYSKVRRNQKFLHKSRVKKFDGFYEALDYAQSLYDYAHDDINCKFDPSDEEYIKINYIYFKKQIMEKNLEKYGDN